MAHRLPEELSQSVSQSVRGGCPVRRSASSSYGDDPSNYVSNFFHFCSAYMSISVSYTSFGSWGSIKMYDANMDEYTITVDNQEVKVFAKTHLITARKILENTDGVSPETHVLVWHWSTYLEILGMDAEVSVHTFKHFSTLKQ